MGFNNQPILKQFSLVFTPRLVDDDTASSSQDPRTRNKTHAWVPPRRRTKTDVDDDDDDVNGTSSIQSNSIRLGNTKRHQQNQVSFADDAVG